MRGILRGSVVSLKQAGPDVGDAKPLLGTVECKALKIAAAPTDSQGLENETLSQFRKDDAPWGDEGSGTFPSPEGTTFVTRGSDWVVLACVTI